MSNIDPLAINFHPEFDLAQLAQGRPSNWPKTKSGHKMWKKYPKMHQLWPWIAQAVVGLLQCSRPFWMTKMAKNQQKKKLLQLAQRRPRYGQKTDKIVGKLVKNLLNGPTSRVSCLMLLNLNLMACDSSKWPCSPQNYIFMCQNHTVNHILTKNLQKLTFWFF